MSVFTRRPMAPLVKGDYTQFRPFVREDFSECCAYCLLHELLAGGADNFELDHFRPQSLFASLVNDFYNLFYACHVCNRHKSNSWPSAELAVAGYRFVDLCRENFSTHFIELESGEWKPLTEAGFYTQARLGLNRRHLVRVRALLREIARLLGRESINWDQPSKDQIARLLTT